LAVDTINPRPYVDPIEINHPAMERQMRLYPTYTFRQFLTRTPVGRVWLVSLLVALLAFTCAAQAREVVHTPQGRIVRDADCLLVVDNSTVRSPCSVGRHAETNNTIVRMNEATMLIKRSEERGVASVYSVEDDGSLTPIATAIADGDCWIGHQFRFCAK
jgi:hypothetical protein